MAYQSQSQTQTLTHTKSKYKATATTLADVSNKLANDSRVTKIQTQSLKPLLTTTVRAPIKHDVKATNKAKTTKLQSTSTDRTLLSRPKHVSLDTIHSKVKVTKQSQPVNLNMYLIDQTPAIVTHDSNEQTDRFIPEQAAQPYIPVKTGTDTGTQIDHDIVYQYDRDIEAINNTIVNKVLEQCLLEVRQEQELAAIKLERLRLTTKHTAEKQAIQQLEIESNVRLQQKQHALQKAQQHAAAQHALHQKLRANRLAYQYTQTVQLAVFEQLHNEQYFIDTDKQHAEQHFTSSIQAISERLQQHALSHAVTDTALSSSVGALLAHQQATQAEHAAIDQHQQLLQQQAIQHAADTQARNALLELYIPLQTTEPMHYTNIPVYITGSSTVAELQVQLNHYTVQLLSTPANTFNASRVQLLLNDTVITDTTIQLYDMLQNSTLQHLKVNVLPVPVEPAAAEPTESENDESSEIDDS